MNGYAPRAPPAITTWTTFVPPITRSLGPRSCHVPTAGGQKPTGGRRSTLWRSTRYSWAHHSPKVTRMSSSEPAESIAITRLCAELERANALKQLEIEVLGDIRDAMITKLAVDIAAEGHDDDTIQALREPELYLQRIRQATLPWEHE